MTNREVAEVAVKHWQANERLIEVARLESVLDTQVRRAQQNERASFVAMLHRRLAHDLGAGCKCHTCLTIKEVIAEIEERDA